jgi:hypothetical protein
LPERLAPDGLASALRDKNLFSKTDDLVLPGEA